MTDKSIWDKGSQLDKVRRDFMRDAVKEFDIEHQMAIHTLQTECGSIGHIWRFTHLGPLNNPWFSCTACHASRVELQNVKEVT